VKNDSLGFLNSNVAMNQLGFQCPLAGGLGFCNESVEATPPEQPQPKKKRGRPFKTDKSVKTTYKKRDKLVFKITRVERKKPSGLGFVPLVQFFSIERHGRATARRLRK
jgi:hypothetical protein